MRLQQHWRKAHEPKDALVIDLWRTSLAPGSVQQSRDAAIAIGGPGIGDGTYLGQHSLVLGTPIRAALRTLGALELLDQVGPRHAKGCRHGLHREASRGGDGKCHACFFRRAASRASRRISVSMLLWSSCG
jgi:hypothetical protein